MRLWSLAALLTLAALAGEAASAQGSPVLNHRVRVTAPSPAGTTTGAVMGGEVRYVGVATSVEGDTLRLAGEGTTHAVPVSAIRHLEVSRGRRGNSGLGALIGAGVGIAYGLATAGSDDGQGSTGVGIVIVPLGAALYGGLGALVGSFIRTERWESVSVEPLRRP